MKHPLPKKLYIHIEDDCGDAIILSDRTALGATDSGDPGREIGEYELVASGIASVTLAMKPTKKRKTKKK